MSALPTERKSGLSGRDNFAVVEGGLKPDETLAIRFEEARQDVFDYIEMFYNPARKHARNGILSPMEFERQQILKAEGV